MNEIDNWRKGIWSKLDWKRFWIHFVVGIVCAWLVYSQSLSGIILSIAFFFYEAIEDWRIQDMSFKDVLGWLWGFGILSLLLSILLFF
jgi:hypothetical protein